MKSTPNAGTYLLGHRSVNRMGYGAMQLAGLRYCMNGVAMNFRPA